MNKDINTIGYRIYECRKRMGYSQETLAAMLYVKKSTICKYEKNEHDIPARVIVEIAKALNISTDYLLKGKEEDNIIDNECLHILSQIKSQEMKRLALEQLRCIVNIQV